MSLMLATASSTRLVTSVSTASGLAPGNGVLTTTMGKSSAGSRSTPSLVHETRPTTSSAPITISMKSGRRMAMLVKDIRLAPYVRSRSARERRACFDLRSDNVAIRKIIEAAGGDQLAVVNARGNLDRPIALQAQLHRLAVHAAGRIDGEDQRLGS